MCNKALRRNSWLSGSFDCINKAKSIMVGAVLAVSMV